MVGADAVDPSVDVIGVDVEACGEGGISLGDPFGLPGQTVPALGGGFLLAGQWGGLRHHSTIPQLGQAG